MKIMVDLLFLYYLIIIIFDEKFLINDLLEFWEIVYRNCYLMILFLEIVKFVGSE